ncbi:hypothetical protein KSW81_002703 [Nannochloris sp. 'desiccata']|nr:hypothetical protein KSW81_002703 [Chlorella desiccata (nom. nud.)]
MSKFVVLITLTLTTLLFSQTCTAANNEEDNPVLVIAGEDELAAAAKAHPYLAVEFYVPWCDHCKALASEWALAASELKKSGSNVVLATANGEEQKNYALNSKYQIKAFPTMKIFQHGNIDHPFNYTGPRTAQEIVQYLEQHAEAAPNELKTIKEAHNQRILLRKWRFLQMADRVVGEIVAAYVTDPSSLLDKGIKCPSPSEKNKVEINDDCDSPFAVMIKPNDTKHPRYQGEFTLDLLIQWALSHATPLVSRYFKDDPEALRDFARAFRVPLPQAIIAFEKARDINKIAYDAVSAAAEANDDLKFTVTAQGAEHGEPLLKSLGVAGDAPAPLFIIFDAKKNEKYLKTGMKLENLPEFIEEYKVGALTSFQGKSSTKSNEGQVEERNTNKNKTVERKNTSDEPHSEL